MKAAVAKDAFLGKAASVEEIADAYVYLMKDEGYKCYGISDQYRQEIARRVAMDHCLTIGKYRTIGNTELSL